MDRMTINGREYAVACNWRACTAFLKAKGTDSMEALSGVVALAPSDIALLAWCCIAEGERIEGRECDLQADFVDLLSIPEAVEVITAFVRIYSDQSTPKASTEEPKKE